MPPNTQEEDLKTLPVQVVITETTITAHQHCETDDSSRTSSSNIGPLEDEAPSTSKAADEDLKSPEDVNQLWNGKQRRRRPCNICTKLKNDPKMLEKHLKTKKHNHGRSYPCPYCPEVLDWKCRLIAHIIKRHERVNRQSGNISIRGKHRRRRKTRLTKVNNINKTAGSVDIEIVAIVPKVLCPLCPAKLRDHKEQKEHRYYAHWLNRDSPVICAVCGIYFVARPDLVRHLGEEHVGPVLDEINSIFQHLLNK